MLLAIMIPLCLLAVLAKVTAFAFHVRAEDLNLRNSAEAAHHYGNALFYQGVMFGLLVAIAIVLIVGGIWAFIL